MNDDFRFADAFSGGLKKPLGTERWLKNKDRIAAARFLLDEFLRRFASDLFIGGPEKYEPLVEGRARKLQRVKSEKRLNEPALHVKCAGAVSFACGNTKRHRAQCARRIDRIVVPEDEELAGRT